MKNRNLFNKKGYAWVATKGNTLDGIIFIFGEDGKISLEVSADQRATLYLSKRQLFRLRRLIDAMIENNFE